jgi:hypothetical protein
LVSSGFSVRQVTPNPTFDSRVIPDLEKVNGNGIN